MAVNIPVEKINDFLGSRMQRDQDEARAQILRERFGNDDGAWDPEFSGLDTSSAQARAAGKKMRDYLASQGTDASRPLRFRVNIKGRDITLEVKPPQDPQDPNAKWETTMPCEIEPGTFERRVLRASGYDEILLLINKQLAAPPLVRDLSVEESLELARMCTQKKNLPDVLTRYIACRIGKTPDESVLRDPRLNHVLDAACLFIFINSEPTSTDTPEFRAFLKTYRGTRPLSLPLVKSCFEEYKRREKAAEQARLKGLTPEGQPLPEHVGEAELQNASGEEIAKSLSGVRRAFAENERRKRELLHTPRTAEQALRDLRGPSDYGEEL